MIITRFTWFAAVVVIAHFGGVALSAAEWELVTPDSYPGLDLALAQDEPVAKAETMAWRILRDDESVADGTATVEAGTKTLVIPAAALPPGPYTLELNSVPIHFRKVDSPLRFANRRWIVNGEEFFPIGLYLPWPNERDGVIIPEQSAEQAMRDLPAIASVGFNAVTVSAPEFYRVEAEQLLDRAAELGLQAFCAAPPDLYGRLGQRHGNILGWLGPDEPEINPDGANFTPEKMRSDYAFRKQFPDALPILMNHSRPAAFDVYRQCRDFAMTDPYTFGRDYHDITRVLHFVREQRRSMSEALPCVVILQIFKLPEGVMRLPTATEMRAQVFLAAALGVDGIYLYSTATPETPGWHLLHSPDSAALWAALPAIWSDLRPMLPVYRRTPKATSQPGDDAESRLVFWRLDHDGGREILTVINLADSEVDLTGLLLPFSGKIPEKLGPVEVAIVESK